MPFDPNPLFYKMVSTIKDNIGREERIQIYNEGGTRSSKTWDTFHLIYYLCDQNRNQELEIYILRDTLVNCKDFTLKEFKKCMGFIGVKLTYKFENTKPYVNLFGNHIYFRGLPEDGDEGYPSDVLYFNEALEMKKVPVDDLIMRCNHIVLADWNPKFTKHWIFDKEGGVNTFFFRSTYLNNKHLPKSVALGIEESEPWLPGSYTVDNGVILYEGKPVTDKNQPPPHPINTSLINEDGKEKKPTADLFRWKVYGLGLRGAMTGLIHPYHVVLDEWPEDVDYILGDDFGFTADPNALVKFGQKKVSEKQTNIYIELLCYDCIETETLMVQTLESLGIDKLKPIICDSSDKHISKDYGVQEMVKGIRNAGYSARKVSKTKNVVYWIGKMNECTINIIRNKFYTFAKVEAENYMWHTIHGIEINQPKDGNDHMWNAARYAFMSYNTNTKIWG